MPKPKKGARLGGSPAHQRLMLANLATSLFEHRRITTTEAKARQLRPVAERLITKAKKGDLHNRRLVMRTIRDKTVVHELFTEIAPQFAERPGGYTRITKIGPRKGDNAPMAVIELVNEPYEPKQSSGSRRSSAPAATTPAVTEEPADSEARAGEAVVEQEPAEETPVAEESEAAQAPVAEESAEDAPAEDAEELAPAPAAEVSEDEDKA